MPYEFTAQEPEPETQASGAHRGAPPNKGTAVDTLDPPRGPAGQHSAIEPLLAAGIIALVIAAIVLVTFLIRH